MGEVQFKKNTVICGYGTILLSGSNAGFKYTGINIDYIVMKDITIIGDGLVASAHAGFSGISGSTINYGLFDNLKIKNCVIGISINSDLGGLYSNVTISNCYINRVVGTESGQGYGIHLATGYGNNSEISVVNNVIIDASRHSIYVAKCEDVSIIGNHIIDHLKTDYSGAVRGALSISRSKNINVVGNTFKNCYGCSLIVTADEGAGFETSNINIIGNTFDTFIGRAIYIGYLSPSTNGVPRNINCSENTFLPGTDSQQTAIIIYCGKDIKIENNIIGKENITNYFNGSAGIIIAIQDDSQFGENIEIKNNIIKLIGDNTRGIIYSTEYTYNGTSSIRIEDNDIAAINELVSIGTITNPNIVNMPINKSRVIQTGLLAPATTAGKIKSTQSLVFIIDRKSYILGATDDKWDLTGITTTNYAKCLLTITAGGSAGVIKGIEAATQASAEIPRLNNPSLCAVGYVELPSGYAGGAIPAEAIYDISGSYY